MKQQATLKPGSTYQDIVDDVEAAVVAYMAGRRGMTELQFRSTMLWDTTTDVARLARESYNRKIARSLCLARAHGMTPEAAAKSMLMHRNNGYSTSPDAGPQLPAAKQA